MKKRTITEQCLHIGDDLKDLDCMILYDHNGVLSETIQSVREVIYFVLKNLTEAMV